MTLLQKDPVGGNPEGDPKPNPNPQDWKTVLPEDIRGEKAFDSIKDVGSLGKSYLEMVKYQGRSVSIPADDARDEEVDKVYRKLGKPESPDKYDSTAPKTMPQDLPLDDERIARFRDKAHKLHLTAKQARGLFEMVIEDDAAKHGLTQKTMEDSEKALKEEWGPSADVNFAYVENFSKAIFSEASMKKLTLSGLANDPDIARDLSRAGRKFLAEDETIFGDGAITQESAQGQIDKILNDPKHPYHQGDKDALTKMARLFAILHPKRPA